MTKFTDSFFLVPVQVFYGETENFDENSEFAVGWARIPYDDLYLANWFEGFNYGKMPMGIEREGFDYTVIRTPNAQYNCTWSVKEFERELNKFMKKIEELHPEAGPDARQEDDLVL